MNKIKIAARVGFHEFDVTDPVHILLKSSTPVPPRVKTKDDEVTELGLPDFGTIKIGSKLNDLNEKLPAKTVAEITMIGTKSFALKVE